MKVFDKPARSTIAACVYAGYVFILTQYPFAITWDWLLAFTRDLSGVFRPTSSHISILNVCLFVPLGFFCYQRLVDRKGTIAAILLATLVGAIFSLFIEILQLFSPRHPSAFDVLANTLGSSLGALISGLWPHQITGLASHLWDRAGGYRIAVFGALIYASIPLVLTFVHSSMPFRIWDSRHSFQLANEATFNRPWLGKIHFAALFNRALSPDEVRAHFRQGFGPIATEGRTKQGLITLYTFAESGGTRVHDLSGLEPAIDLVMFPKSNVRWLDDSHGLEILKPAIIVNRSAGTRLARALSAGDELTIEVWITPRDLRQAGPARIVSFSRNLRSRNFTLGQDASAIEFRLRTPASGMSGTPLSLWTTDDLPASYQPIHVVATYQAGIERLYLNGNEQAESLDVTRIGIIAFGTKKTPLAQMAYVFLYFFPVSFLVAALLSSTGSRATVWVAAAIGTGMLATTEIVQVLVFERSMDIGVIAYGLGINIIGTLTGQAFTRAGSIPQLAANRASIEF